MASPLFLFIFKQVPVRDEGFFLPVTSYVDEFDFTFFGFDFADMWWDIHSATVVVNFSYHNPKG